MTSAEASTRNFTRNAAALTELHHSALEVIAAATDGELTREQVLGARATARAVLDATESATRPQSLTEVYIPVRTTTQAAWPGPCTCECQGGGFCGGCGHTGCAGRRR